MRQRSARLALTVAVAAVAGLAFAAPASAANTASTPILHQTNVTLDNSKFDTCEGITPIAGKDVWVFVWPGDQENTPGELLELDLYFDGDNDGDSTDPGEHLTKAEVTNTTDNGVLKVVAQTPAGWVLVSGTSTIQGKVKASPGGIYVFNLTHGCAGSTSTSTPTPEATGTPSPGTSETASPGVSESSAPGTSHSASPSPSGGLPVTGVAWGATALTAVGLIAAGVALMAVRRRRELTEENPTEL